MRTLKPAAQHGPDPLSVSPHKSAAKWAAPSAQQVLDNGTKQPKMLEAHASLASLSCTWCQQIWNATREPHMRHTLLYARNMAITIYCTLINWKKGGNRHIFFRFGNALAMLADKMSCRDHGAHCRSNCGRNRGTSCACLAARPIQECRLHGHGKSCLDQSSNPQIWISGWDQSCSNPVQILPSHVRPEFATANLSNSIVSDQGSMSEFADMFQLVLKHSILEGRHCSYAMLKLMLWLSFSHEQYLCRENL